MSKFEKYRIQEPSKSRFEKYRIQEPQSQEQGWGELLGKSALKGIAGIADIPQMVGAGAEGLVNYARTIKGNPAEIYARSLSGENPETIPKITIDENAPQTDYIPNKSFFSSLAPEPKPTTTGQKIASKAVEYGFPGGLLGKLSKAGSFARGAAEGAAIGGTSGGLQEAGVSPIAADIGSALTIPTGISAIKNAPGALVRGTATGMGLNPKNINLEAAKSARDLGVDLPAAALTDSTLTALANQYVSKTPFFGNILKTKDVNVEKKVLEGLDKAYERVGPENTPQIRADIESLYDITAKTLPENAQIYPKHTLNIISELEKKIKTAAPSSGEKELLSELETIRSTFAPSGIKGIPMPVDFLVGTKKSLNSTIKWNKDEGVKNLLRRVQNSLLEDIKEYGKTNPKWYENFKGADELFGKVAKRERLEELLSGKSINAATDSLSYNALAKTINNPQKAKEIKNLAGEEVFEKIKKLGDVAKAMAIKSKNIPNPSGTALTAGAASLTAGLITNPIGTLSGLGISGTVATPLATYLLTNKRFLDQAIKFAEGGGRSHLQAVSLNEQFKKLTGYSLLSIDREINKNNQAPEQ